MPEAPQDMVSNVSVLLTWTDPGGDVDKYIVVYAESLNSNNEFNVTVIGTMTSVVLMNLDSSTTYSVTIFTVNSIGTSAISSPQLGFTTGRKSRGRQSNIYSGIS